MKFEQYPASPEKNNLAYKLKPYIDKDFVKNDREDDTRDDEWVEAFENKFDHLAKILEKKKQLLSKDRAWKDVQYRGGYLFFHRHLPSVRSEGEQLSKFKKEHSVGALGYALDDDKKSIIETLGKQYKIHLMPKQEFIPYIAEKILLATEKDTFHQSLDRFKVYMDPSIEPLQDDDGNFGPIVVIYPRLGKEHAQVVLDEIIKLFADDTQIAFGKEPPLNTKITSLIYYAQSDSSIRRKILKAEDSAQRKESWDVLNKDNSCFKNMELTIPEINQ